jgi:hypothetical protein
MGLDKAKGKNFWAENTFVPDTYLLHTPQVPPFFAQCLQYLQFLQAWQSLAPVQVAKGLCKIVGDVGRLWADRTAVRAALISNSFIVVRVYVYNG